MINPPEKLYPTGLHVIVLAAQYRFPNLPIQQYKFTHENTQNHPRNA